LLGLLGQGIELLDGDFNRRIVLHVVQNLVGGRNQVDILLNHLHGIGSVLSKSGGGAYDGHHGEYLVRLNHCFIGVRVEEEISSLPL